MVGSQCNFGLSAALVAQIRQVALYRKLLLAVDGLANYITAFCPFLFTPWNLLLELAAPITL